MKLLKCLSSVCQIKFMSQVCPEYKWLIRLKQGDERALRHFYGLYADLVFAVARQFIKHETEIEDLVQDVFLRLWNSRLLVDEEKELHGLLYVMTKRLALNRLKKLSRERLSMLDVQPAEHQTESEDAYSSLQAKELYQLEEDVLRGLPLQQRKVYELSRSDGMTYKEIGKQLGISSNTVRNHLVQSLKQFRLVFKKYGYHLILFFLTFH